VADSGDGETIRTAETAVERPSAPEPSGDQALKPPPGAAASSAGPFNTLALVSLVAALVYFAVGIGLGVAGWTAPVWLAGLPVIAVVAGYVARGQTVRNGRGGSYLALAGLVLGFVALALLAFGWALVLLAGR